MRRGGTSQLRCSGLTFLQLRSHGKAAYSTATAPYGETVADMLSQEPPERSPPRPSHAAKSWLHVGDALHQIVEQARRRHREPLPPHESPIKPKFYLNLSQWLTYAHNVAPSPSQKEPLFAEDHSNYVKRIIRNLNSKHDILKGISKKQDLSAQDVLHIINNLDSKALAFDFYQWLRLQPFYIADQSIYYAVIGCILDCPSSEIVWHHLQEVMKHMIWRKMYIDDCMFVQMLLWGQPGNSEEPYSVARVECYAKWFMDMRAAGFQPHSSVYAKLMKICNRAGLYGSTLSLFKDIPMNNYLWAYTLALFACRGMKNLELAENYWKEMKMIGLKPAAESFTLLLSWYRDKGDADKAESLFREMQDEGVTPDLSAYISLLEVCVSLGRLKQAEGVFKHGCESGVLDPAMHHATLDC